MATRYSTIKQHQDLRIPEGWSKQERALIVQLEEVFDDIYRRFGRLTAKDLGDELTEKIDSIDDKYEIVSDVIISELGVTVQGNRYVHVLSGATFSVESDNFVIDSDAQYMQINGTDTTTNKDWSWRFDKHGVLYLEEDDQGELTTRGLVISEDGITVNGSKSVTISGGTFNVTSTNFVIDSQYKYLKLATDENHYWQLDSSGLSYYTVESSTRTAGLQLTSGGITLTGSKSVTINSGGSVSITTGQTGAFTLTAPNFSISSTGKSIATGDWTLDSNGLKYVSNGSQGIGITSSGLTIASGKSITVQSGGSVSITTGTGSFSVTAPNFAISSSGKYITAGNWTLSDSGLTFTSGGVQGIAISSSGLTLTGKNLTIASGGYISITGTNFTLNSSSKQLSIGSWLFSENGVSYNGQALALGSSGLSINNSWSFTTSGAKFDNGSQSFRICTGSTYPTDVSGGLYFLKNPQWGCGQLRIYCNAPSGNSFLSHYLVIESYPDSRTGHILKLTDDGNSLSEIEFGYALFGSMNVTHAFIAEEDAEVRGDLSVTGTLSAGTFSLTTLKANTVQPKSGSTLTLSNGTSYFDIATSGGDVRLRPSGTSKIGTSNNYITDAYITSLHQGSSREKKRDIQLLKDYGAIIDELEPVSFIYKDDSTDIRHMGLIYEDTVGLMPEVCQEEEDTEDDGTIVVGKSINYLELIPVLLKEIQSLRQRIKHLEEEATA
jgi:hypothetical protein